MPAWPSTLPTPSLDNYSLKPTPAVARTDMDSGPARQRQRFTQAPTKIPVTFELTIDQLATFEAWFVRIIHRGADWFDCPLINGLGYAPMRARIIASEDPPYEATPQGNGANWQVKTTFEVDAMPILSDADLAGRL